MAEDDIWAMIHAERHALANDLETTPTDAWDTPSLCPRWSVRDVLAHMTATAHITPASFFPKLIGAGLSMRRMQARDIAVYRGASPAETLAGFRWAQSSTKHPPGPTDTWLGETLVHAEDIRRPLGIKHEYSAAGATRVADLYKHTNLAIGAKRRIAGIRLRATDAVWTHGEGPEASGPIMSLVMAMAGRKAALDDLTGEGVAILRDRP